MHAIDGLGLVNLLFTIIQVIKKLTGLILFKVYLEFYLRTLLLLLTFDLSLQLLKPLPTALW